MRARSSLLLHLGLVILVLAGVSATADDRGESELRALIPKIVQAWETMDIAKVDRYYATDFNLAFFDVAPLKYANWAEYRIGVQKAFFEPNRSLKFTIKDDLRVRVTGKVGWATFTFGADILSKQGAATHLDARWTMILEQRKTGWIVVHEHVSVPMAGS